MPIKKIYWMYKRLHEQGGNSRVYNTIIRCARNYYRRQVADPETCAVMKEKRREYYEKNKEEIKRKQRERYHRKKNQT